VDNLTLLVGLYSNAAMATREVVTEADLLRAPRDGRKRELVDGRIAVSPAGYRHGRIAARLVRRLEQHADEGRLGDVLDSSTGFRLPGGNVRSPDVAFVARGRVNGPEPRGFFDGAPDLAVEILSPDDDPRALMDKVGEYLRAGTRLVWVIDPERRIAAVYRSTADVCRLTESDPLTGDELLPGFACRLSDVLGPT
jgi:Uma2 family endonuclease